MDHEAEDGCQTLEWSGNETYLGVNSITEEYQDSSLLCVDYQLDQEVFCELLPPAAQIVDSVTFEEHVDEQIRGRRFNTPSCGEEWFVSNATNRVVWREQGARRMKIGNLVIAWTGEDSNITHVNEYGGTFLHPNDYTGSDRREGGSTRRTARLIQFDARYDFVVYEEQVWEGVSRSEGVYSDQSTEYFMNGTSSSTQSERVVMQLGARREVLFESAKQDSADSQFSVWQGTMPSSTLGECVQSSPQESSTSSSFMDSIGNHLYSGMSFSGSYAIDRNQRLGLSQEIREFEFPHNSAATATY
jgi:hypothetical protein